MTIDHLVFFGCSLTYGIDSATDKSMADYPELRFKHPGRDEEQMHRKEEYTYPAVIANRLGMTYENTAHSANTNDIMMCQAHDWLLSNTPQRIQNTLAVFAVTSPFRISTTVVQHGRRRVAMQSGNYADRTSVVMATADEYERDHRLKKLANIMLDEEIEFMETHTAFWVLGVKQLFHEYGGNLCTVNMLFPREKAATAYHGLNLFDTPHHHSIVEKISARGVQDHGNMKTYFSAYTNHFTRRGYEIAADFVLEDMKPHLERLNPGQVA
jgi:hypothetical protein